MHDEQPLEPHGHVRAAEHHRRVLHLQGTQRSSVRPLIPTLTVQCVQDNVAVEGALHVNTLQGVLINRNVFQGNLNQALVMSVVGNALVDR